MKNPLLWTLWLMLAAFTARAATNAISTLPSTNTVAPTDRLIVDAWEGSRFVTRQITVSNLLRQAPAPTWPAQVLDPTGWVNQDATGTFLLTSNEVGTYTLTLSNNAGMPFLMNGVSTNWTSVAATFPTNRGLYFITISNGTFSATASTNAWGLSDAQVATVFCDTNGLALITAETHGAGMDWATHRRFHASPNDGAVWASGLGVAAGANSILVGPGTMFDEDRLNTIPQTTNVLVGYADASGYITYRGPRKVPYLTNSANGNLQYNLGGTNLADCANNQYACVWVYATPIVSNSIVCVLGRVAGSLATVQASAPPALLPNFAASEAVLLAQVIWKNSATIAFDSVIDYRAAKVTGSASTTGASGTWTDGYNAISFANGAAQSYVSSNFLALASIAPFSLAGYGTNVLLTPANGNLQSYTITNVCNFGVVSLNTNCSEFIRLELTASNQVIWTNSNLSNTASLGPSNGVSVILLDRPAGTNLWNGYRLR